MSDAVDRYNAISQALAELRAQPYYEDDEEDALLDVLGDIWNEMTREERALLET